MWLALTAVLIVAALIGYEAILQAKQRRTGTILSKEKIEDFPEVYEGRSEEEFRLGLALHIMIDMDMNPEEYEEADLDKLENLFEEADAYWSMKYEQRIKNLDPYGD